MAALLAEGVSEKAARDWLAVRKAKRAVLTETALDDVKAEAAKAGLSLHDAVVLCAARSWQGFNATWLEPKTVPGARGIPAAAGGNYAQTMANAAAAKDLILGKGRGNRDGDKGDGDA